MDGNTRIRFLVLFCIMMCVWGQPQQSSFATEKTLPATRPPPSARANTPARSRERCPVDNSSVAEPEKAGCSWCPESCSMLHMFSCAGSRTVWGSHDLGARLTSWPARTVWGSHDLGARLTSWPPGSFGAVGCSRSRAESTSWSDGDTGVDPTHTLPLALTLTLTLPPDPNPDPKRARSGRETRLRRLLKIYLLFRSADHHIPLGQ